MPPIDGARDEQPAGGLSHSQSIPVINKSKQKIVKRIKNKKLMDEIEQAEMLTKESPIEQFVSDWMRQDPDKEPFKPKLHTEIELYAKRSFTNLKRNVSAHKIIAKER